MEEVKFNVKLSSKEYMRLLERQGKILKDETWWTRLTQNQKIGFILVCLSMASMLLLVFMIYQLFIYVPPAPNTLFQDIVIFGKIIIVCLGFSWVLHGFQVRLLA